MYIKLNRTACPSQSSFCDRCLGQFFKFPLGYERHCFEDIIKDGKEELTIDLYTGADYRRLVLSEEERKQLRGGSWDQLIEMSEPVESSEV